MGLLSNIYSTLRIQNILLPCGRYMKRGLIDPALKHLQRSVYQESLTTLWIAGLD